MSIFSKIKDAIFGKKAQAAEAPKPAVAPPAAAPAPTAVNVSEVDIAVQLSGMDGADNLNWRTSIVDLFKLLGIDSSYENRKELAHGLGRADYSGSAEDNIWLHKATMRELAANGGKVPADMLN